MINVSIFQEDGIQEAVEGIWKWVFAFSPFLMPMLHKTTDPGDVREELPQDVLRGAS